MDRAERTGLGVAVIGHVLLFGALSLSLMSPPKPLEPLNKPLDVILVEETALESTAPEIAEAAAPPAPEPLPEPAPAPASAPAVAAPPAPPIPRPEPEPVVRPVPKPIPAPKPMPKPKPAPKPEPKPKPKPAAVKPKPATAKPTPPKAKPQPTRTATATGARDPRPTDRLKGLNLGGSGQSTTATRTGGSNTSTGSGAGASGPAKSGAPAQKTAAQIKQSIRASIYTEVRPKFRQLAPDGVDIEQLVTTLQVRVNPNGSLAGEPQLISQTGKTDSNRPQQALHVERAIKAVKVAAPFAMSEKDFVGIQVIELEFKIQ